MDEATHVEETQEGRVTKTGIDIVEFCAILGFKPFDYQVDFLRSCVDNFRIVGLFCRQTGKSTCLAAYCLYHALLVNNATILIIAPTERQANLLFEKIKYFVNTAGRFFDEHITRTTADEIAFANKSQIKVLPVGDDGRTIRGHTASVIVLEESSEIKDRIVSSVIMPMGATQPFLKIIQIGTPKGKNHFFQAYKSPYYVKHHHTWQDAVDNGLIQQEFIDEVKSTISKIEFDTEYGAEFIEDADKLFKWALIEECIMDYELYNPDTITY